MPLTWLKRQLNPRYNWLPSAARAEIGSILDIGGEGTDSFLAAQYLPRARFTAINIAVPESLAPGAVFIQADLDRDGLAAVEGDRFDYVICSHTLEHLGRGTDLLADIAARIAPGGYLYLEWPSLRALDFPLRGLGLNFYDDPTHVTPIGLEKALDRLRQSGLTILVAGPRRNRFRQILAPLLFVRSCWKHRRVVLYDFWDWTGYADRICAYRPKDIR